MKAIITQTLQEFESLQSKIHQGLVNNLPNYKESNGFLKWAEPTLKNTETGYYACPVEVTGLRGAIILGLVLTDEEKHLIVELDKEDETWFPKIEE